MFLAPHWELRSYLREFRLDDGNPKARRNARWPVLSVLMLHANNRLRCWPSTDVLCKETGFNKESVIEARDWLLHKLAIKLVPYEKREGAESKLPPRQFVYQLTGSIITSTGIRLYIAMNDETKEAVAQEIDALIFKGRVSEPLKVLSPEVSTTRPKGLTIESQDLTNKVKPPPADSIVSADSSATETSVQSAGAGAGESDDGLNPDSEIVPDERPNVFRLYEQATGLMITSMISDELLALETEYPAGWLEDAFKETAANGVKSLNYTKAILHRWKIDGKDKPDEPRSTRVNEQTENAQRRNGVNPRGHRATQATTGRATTRWKRTPIATPSAAGTTPQLEVWLAKQRKRREQETAT